MRNRLCKLNLFNSKAYFCFCNKFILVRADLGVSQQTIMAHYMSNHVAVAYGDIFHEMVALIRSLGFRVRIVRGS